MAISIGDAITELKKLLSENRLCIFTGSGVSVPPPSCLPTWDEFTERYIEICKIVNDLADADNRFDDLIADARIYKKKNVINTVTALKDKIAFCRKKGMSVTVYENKIMEMFLGKQYNEYHKTIVSTNYKYILTTNYDTLLEDAALDLDYKDLIKRVYSFTEINKISEAVYLREPAIIHVHGTAKDLALESFVLTKDDYMTIIDRNPGLRTLLDSLFMSYSILMVGYGGSDPHMEDIIDDINLSLQWINTDYNLNLPVYYLVLKKDKVSPVIDHIKNRNRTRIIAVDDYSEAFDLLRSLQMEYPR